MIGCYHSDQKLLIGKNVSLNLLWFGVFLKGRVFRFSCSFSPLFALHVDIGAVIIPERQANQTLGILQGISKEEECKKRQACWDIYQKYMADDTKVIAGLIDGWESIFSTGKTLPLAGVQCQRGDNLCNGT
jgi:hypothetical protein